MKKAEFAIFYLLPSYLEAIELSIASTSDIDPSGAGVEAGLELAFA